MDTDSTMRLSQVTTGLMFEIYISSWLALHTQDPAINLQQDGSQIGIFKLLSKTPNNVTYLINS